MIEKEENLSQSGNATVSGDARVSGNAWVGGDATVSDNATVSRDALICSKHHLWTTLRMGSRNDVTTFFRNANNQISVVCGCFYGTIDEFAEQVKKTHGDNKHARDYYMAIQMAKIWIDLSEIENETEN